MFFRRCKFYLHGLRYQGPFMLFPILHNWFYAPSGPAIGTKHAKNSVFYPLVGQVFYKCFHRRKKAHIVGTSAENYTLVLPDYINNVGVVGGGAAEDPHIFYAVLCKLAGNIVGHFFGVPVHRTKHNYYSRFRLVAAPAVITVDNPLGIAAPDRAMG